MKRKIRDPRIEQLPGGQFAWSCEECGNGDIVDALDIERIERSLELHSCQEEKAYREHESQ